MSDAAHTDALARMSTAPVQLERPASEDIVEPDVPAIDLLLGRARREHIKHLFVSGKKVVADGKVISVDLATLEQELLRQLRAAVHSTADVRAAMPELRNAIRAHYGEPLYCV